MIAWWLVACTEDPPEVAAPTPTEDPGDPVETTLVPTSPDGTTCGSGAVDVDGVCVPCDGPVGTQHELHLDQGGEQRTYLLHVPEAYACTERWPVLFDLHGTASYLPEEAYGLDGAIDAADAEGFVLVRPRSRSSSYGGYDVYRWDQNPGDPELNHAFLLALLADLRTRYAIDADRVYVMGFSSGTNQTAVAAEDPATPFRGFGHVGGGAWSVASQQPIGRFYQHTPFRDYMHPYQRTLTGLLDDAGVPDTDRLVRQSYSGHELYDWVYPELWAFLDRGERPDPGVVGADWTPVAGAPGDLVGVTVRDGLAWFTAADGGLVAWDGLGFDAAVVSGSPQFAGAPLTSVCFTPDGRGAAVGGGNVLWTDDDGASWRHLDPVREPGPPMFGYAHWTGVGCGSARVMGVGYWSAGSSVDGDAWDDAVLGTPYRAQAQAAAQNAAGTWMTAGYYRWLGRSDDGVAFTPVSAASLADMDWVLDVAPVDAAGPGVWIAVGDGGTVLRSADDGRTFTVVADTGFDLYAVAFDGLDGLAVGRAGGALATEDGGLTWFDRSLGIDGMLSDVAALPTGQWLVAGEGGPYVASIVP